MDNKMADKTMTTCASVLYALFQKRPRKCTCLCHTNKNKSKSKTTEYLELNANNFFHCKCSLDCQSLRRHCPKCGKPKYAKETKKRTAKKQMRKKIVKFQIEHTGSNTNLVTSPVNRKNSLLCTCEFSITVPTTKGSPSPLFYKTLNVKPAPHLYSPKSSPGKFSLQDFKSSSNGSSFLSGKQSNTASIRF